MSIDHREAIEKLMKDLNSVDRDKLHTITVKQIMLLDKIVGHLFCCSNKEQSQKPPVESIPDGYIPVKDFLARWPILGYSTLAKLCQSEGNFKNHSIKIRREWFVQPDYIFALLSLRPIYSRRIDAINRLSSRIIEGLPT